MTRKYCAACDQSMPIEEDSNGNPHERTTPAGTYQVQLVCGHWSGVVRAKPSPKALSVREHREPEGDIS